MQASGDVGILRGWLDSQKHLPHQLITDEELKTAYLACGQSISVTKQVVDLHYTMRTHVPFFHNLVADHTWIRSINGLLKILPKTDSNGNLVIYGRLLNPDPKAFNMRDIIRLFVMISDLHLYEHGHTSGLVFLADLSGITLTHLTKIDLSLFQRFMQYVQEAIFINVKAIHFLNAPSYMDNILRFIRPFIRTSLLEMIQIHKGYSVAGVVDMTYLPKEVGGQGKTFAELHDEMFKKLTGNDKFFINQSKKVVIESNRVDRNNSIVDRFGTEGSFKKLDID